MLKERGRQTEADRLKYRRKETDRRTDGLKETGRHTDKQTRRRQTDRDR